MINLIGLPLEQAIKTVEAYGLKAKIVVNNFCVNQDVQLVTNAKTEGDTVIITVGEFLFNIKE